MHGPVLIGMANSPLLPPGEIAESLRRRRAGVAGRIESTCVARAGQQLLAAVVAAIFERGLAMLRAEPAWIDNTPRALEGPRCRPTTSRSNARTSTRRRRGTSRSWTCRRCSS